MSWDFYEAFYYCHILTLLGIIRCDMVAESIIAAAAEIGPLKVPMVVRLQGTNSEEGLKLVSYTLKLTSLKNRLKLNVY